MAEERPPSLEKKLIRTSPVLWVLGAVFAAFLGGLGTQGLSDAADIFTEPNLREFSERLVTPFEERRAELDREPDPRGSALTAAETDVSDLSREVALAEQGWRTWLETRATLGKQEGEDKELRARRDRIDKLRADAAAAETKLERLRREPDPRVTKRNALQRQIAAAEREAEEAFTAAHRSWMWKVLAARMVLIAPVWIIALVLWRRRQRTAYVTLLWGYWAFALWMLLWGIGPYLPRYGGYGPLALGIAVTIWGSITLAKWFNSRAPARRRRIVDQAIAKHRCPACDRDYLVGRESALEVGKIRKATVRHYDLQALHPAACPGCGLSLFGPCPNCQSVQLVHVERCASCAKPWPQPGAV